MKHATKAIEKTPRRVTVMSGTVDEFVGRSLARARKLDRGEKLRTQITLAFEDPSDLVRVLSAQRVRLLNSVRSKPAPVSDLAITLHRDRKSVRRDVSLLESFGLVHSREEINPGHGRRKIVSPRAAKYRFLATI